jgi:hypothetical protein
LLARAPLALKQLAFRLTPSRGKDSRLDQRRRCAWTGATAMTIQFVSVVQILRIFADSITREDRIAEWSKAARR